MPKQPLISITKKDFKIETFCAGGPGGQHQNKTDSGVRITHIESDAVGESRSERSQHQNKKLAFDRLTKHPKFKIWLSRKAWEIISGKTIEQKVDKAMDKNNLKIECKDNHGCWTAMEID